MAEAAKGKLLLIPINLDALIEGVELIYVFICIKA
jgi:hypothetical protein